MTIPCVVYITAAVLTPRLSELWRTNMRGSRCQFRFYNNARVERSSGVLGIRAEVDKVRPWAFKADLWRYAQLARHGGIFFDAETRLERAPESIFDLEQDALQIPRDRNSQCLYNAAMACGAAPGPGSKAVTKILERALSNVRSGSYGHGDSSTEPWLGITGPCTAGRALTNHEYVVIGRHVSPHTVDAAGHRLFTIDNSAKGDVTNDTTHYGHHWGQRSIYYT